MNKKLIILLAAIGFLFAGCKKEKDSFDNKGARMVMHKLPYTPPLKGIYFTYPLTASIVSPGGINTREYGFIINDFGLVPKIVGSGEMIGSYEMDYKSLNYITDGMVVAYAVLTTGDSLRSDRFGIIPGPGQYPDPKPSIKLFAVTPYSKSDTRLYLDVQYNKKSGYTVHSSELIYKDNAVSAWSKYPAPGGLYITGFTLDGYLPNALNTGVLYDFKLKVILNPPSNSSLPPIVLTSPTTQVIPY